MSSVPSDRMVLVRCEGKRKDGSACNKVLGEFSHPFRKRCDNCGEWNEG